MQPTIFCQKSKSDGGNGEIGDAAHDYDVEVSDCGGGSSSGEGLVTSVRLIALTDISASLIFNGDEAAATAAILAHTCTIRTVCTAVAGERIIRGERQGS